MKRISTYILLALAIGSIWIAGARNAGLIEMRDQYDLNQAEPLENTPPLVAFTTVALGGFRGLLVDALWMRLSRLQSEGKYFELVQLADWITKLEPRSAAIWSYQAWNLSYNISVLMSSDEDRWRWVYHGVKLLRDDGLKYNHGSAKLYKELGWIFQHKIGSDSDQAHWHYKRQWYQMMDQILQGPRPDYTAWSDLPADRKELRGAQTADIILAEFQNEDIDPFNQRWINPAERPARMQKILAAHPQGADIYLRFLRRLVLRERYKMDPELMEEIEGAYGPLDWRVPETHAIYWAKKGIPYARTKFEQGSLTRMMYQSMAALMRHGRFIYIDGELLNLPDIELFPHVNRIFQDALGYGPQSGSFDDAYLNFLFDALMLSIYLQRDDQAHDIFDQIKALDIEKMKDQTFDSLAANLSRTPVEQLPRHRALAKIYGLLMQSAESRAAGKTELAQKLRNQAKADWESFMAVRQNPNVRKRTGLPPFDTIKAAAK